MQGNSRHACLSKMPKGRPFLAAQTKLDCIPSAGSQPRFWRAKTHSLRQFALKSPQKGDELLSNLLFCGRACTVKAGKRCRTCCFGTGYGSILRGRGVGPRRYGDTALSVPFLGSIRLPCSRTEDVTAKPARNQASGILVLRRRTICRPHTRQTITEAA